MTDTLFDLPPAKPPWRELQERHGIFTHHSDTVPDGAEWSAWYFGVLEPDYVQSWQWPEKDCFELIAEYCALIDDRGGEAEAATEREAVVTLIHRRKLEGWETVSVK